MPYESSYPPITPPKEDMWTFLFERQNDPTKDFPDTQPIYIDANTDRSLTYAEVRDQAKAFGIGLKSLWEWRKNDVLCVFSTNNIDTPAITWGTLWAGGCITPANPAYTVDELTFQLKDSGAKGIVTIPPFLDTVKAACKNVGIPEDRILIMGDKKVLNYTHWRDLIDPSTSVRWRKTKVNVTKDVAFLVYSSGTTGTPKGVMLSHQNVASNIAQLIAGESENLSWKTDKILAFLPFFHIYGLTCLIHHAIYTGRPLIVMDKFDLEHFCKLVQKHKITMVYAVPPVILLLAKHPLIANYDLSSIRMINSGAAPLTEELVKAVWARLQIPIKQGYGLSETAPVTHTQKWELWQSTIGAVGHLLPSLSVKYIDEDANEVPRGQTGEICVKGPNVMLGYHNKPDATKNAFTEDGFFRTGDVGHEDKDGNVYITDRAKELIKYKGFQVPPAELEGKLAAHPKIADVGVVGVYDESIASEVPRAYIVLTPGVKEEGMEKEIVDWIAERVAHYKRLRGGVRFVEAIPKSPSGKILRRLIKLMAKEEMEKAKTVKAKL
ncbi:acetyl-CoA synthetase-like protein [Ascodesmis nigricans]|uniref:Acetyl-CoA synthetase-like protein n=1 Tax=Ascodesmis nigricans TaxID=341454 RepID=A0A4S2MQG0_9PEZI|nr:acetyl-CoA synthetase-like protein [Ascodesmis nigricans]